MIESLATVLEMLWEPHEPRQALDGRR